jgi:hypothetical protein
MRRILEFPLLILGTNALREWTEIVLYHSLSVYDGRFSHDSREIDPLRFTDSPSNPPTQSPSFGPSPFPTVTRSKQPSRIPTSSPMPSPSPSIEPSSVESSKPSKAPSIDPSLSPTKMPSSYPSYTTIPSEVPTIATRYPPNAPPEYPDESYFDYNDEHDANWGPGYPELLRLNSTTYVIEYKNNVWGTRTTPADWYWKEFDQNGTGPWAGILANKNPYKNRCERIGEQSPIDVRDNGGVCNETHQIRTKVSEMENSIHLYHRSMKLYSSTLTTFLLATEGGFYITKWPYRTSNIK